MPLILFFSSLSIAHPTSHLSIYLILTLNLFYFLFFVFHGRHQPHSTLIKKKKKKLIFFLKKNPLSLRPFLHHDSTPLEIRQIPQHQTLVAELLAREGCHEDPGTSPALRVGGLDEGVDVADGVGGVEAGGETGAIS